MAAPFDPSALTKPTHLFRRRLHALQPQRQLPLLPMYPLQLPPQRRVARLGRFRTRLRLCQRSFQLGDLIVQLLAARQQGVLLVLPIYKQKCVGTTRDRATRRMS